MILIHICGPQIVGFKAGPMCQGLNLPGGVFSVVSPIDTSCGHKKPKGIG